MPRSIIQRGGGILRYLHRSDALVRPSRVAVANGLVRRISLSTNHRLMNPTAKTIRPSVILSRPLINFFATTSTPDEETKTAKSKGSKTGKKTTKKRSSTARAKAKPKPRKKLTEKQKEAKKVEKTKELVKQLQKTALEPPKKLIDNPWNLTIATVAKEIQARGVKGTDFVTQCSHLAQSISAEERERIAVEAEANKAANAAAYNEWIKQHTPLQIRDANAARRRLSKIKNKSLPLLRDDRQVKRPRTAYLLYMLDRTAEGDFKYMKAKDIAVRVTEEWKGLTTTEKEAEQDSDTEDTHSVHSSLSHCPSLFSHDDRSSVSSGPVSVSSVNFPPDRAASLRFRPENIYPDHFTLADIEVPRGRWVYLACPGSKRKCPHCKVHVSHSDCIVVAIDGACSNNGKNGARSSYGVCWGYDNVLNTATAIEGDHHTNQVAELRACLRALHDVLVVKSLREDNEGGVLNTVVIKSDSEYLVRGVTEWLPKWKENGWKNSRGLDVVNREQFRAIELFTEFLEERQIIVKFWHVPRENNREADALAKGVLKGVSNQGLGLLPPF
ncbi:uncharacterized protein CDV56_108797 [Aspergillus thermomutatus]|uniref:ribonuclease H n=1 Tax=Aspergillus thermomutatus TaxID=41047 RepID=A0A397HDW7_ASPTH|nr:uncharacterized protein CDV56_108797 [Aspergillus thermomutatus]RHZ60238.1 hypothetical protein CDV56_108797 [Aspergillus thermomutatus]